jgi:hypothetical protein
MKMEKFHAGYSPGYKITGGDVNHAPYKERTGNLICAVNSQGIGDLRQLQKPQSFLFLLSVLF